MVIKMKKLLLLSAALVLSCLLLSSCKLPSFGNKPGGNVDPPDGSGTEEENFLFDKDSELYFIVDEFAGASASVTNLINTIDSNRDTSIQLISKDSEEKRHEIIIGDSDREVSKSARRRFDRIEKNLDTDVRFAIYTDGTSLAVIYDEDEGKIALESAITYLISILDTESYAPRAGSVKEDCINIYDYYSALDDAYENGIWKQLSDYVGGTSGAKLVSAMQSLYSLYSPDMVVWMANLYEPAMCVCNGLYGESECRGTKYCGTGAFYYSNSARDNIGYLPDIESTRQALGLLNSTGITRETDGNWAKMLDEQILDAILAFVRSIQREDGYFVHPQWQDPGVSRISRDLSSATGILNTLKESPYYTTPTGIPGIGAPKAQSALKLQLSDNRVAACSAVLSVSSQSYLPHLESVETFKKYLTALDVKNNSYSAGNTLVSQSTQISARDKQLGLSGEGSLVDTMFDHLDACQNPENGTWDYKKPGEAAYDLYYQVNGLMKISGIYGSSRKMNYIDEAIETAISAITYDAPASGAVDIYNPWFALTNIFDNLNGTGGEEGTLKIKAIRERLYASSEQYLNASKNKIAVFMKDDGSFSYHPEFSSATSQGCDAAVPNSREGDLNGTVLSSSGLLDYIYSALGLEHVKVPLFGNSERVLFLNEIRKLKHFDKPNATVEAEPEDFESFDDGEIPMKNAYYEASVNSTMGSVKVIERDDGEGKALLIDSRAASSGDSVKIKNPSKNVAATTAIFEGDFRIDSSSAKYPVQIFMGSAYLFTFRIENNTVRIVESSSANYLNSIDRDLGVSIPFSEWFRVRVEYYHGNHDDVRIKFYFDGDLKDDEDIELISVSDNYYDRNGVKINNPGGTPDSTFQETNIFILSDASLKMQIDNVISYSSLDKYVATADPEGKILYNVDKTAPEKSYDFESGIPADFILTGSEIKVLEADGSKMLTVSSPKAKSDFTVPVNNVLLGGKCLSVSFDIKPMGAKNGDLVMTIVEKASDGNVVGYALVCKDNYLVLCEYNGVVGKELSDIKLPLSKVSNLRIDNYKDYKLSILYLNGEFMGTSSLLYEGGNRRVATDVQFSFTENLGCTVALDNLNVERNGNKYLDQVKPEIDSVINDFEGNNEGIVLGAGASVTAYGSSKMAKLDSTSSKSEIKIPINRRSKISSAIDVELDLIYNKASQNGSAHRITVVDADGGIIFGVVLVIKDGNAEIYEITREGEPRVYLGSFKATSSASIGFEVYMSDAKACIYLGSTCLALTECFPAMENFENEAAYLTVSSADAGSVLLIDNVKAESLYMAFTAMDAPETPEGVDKSEKLDFELSSNTVLPERLYFASNGNVEYNIKTVLDAYTGVYSNAVVSNTKKGYNDTIGIQLPEDAEPLDASCVTFEADFNMDITGGEDSYKYWIYLSQDNHSSESVAYQVILIVRNGKLCFEDRSANSGYQSLDVRTSISAEGWHRLKIEYFKGNKDTARIRLYIDDEIIYVSKNYLGNVGDASPDARTGITKAFFYSMQATEANLYLDNVSLYASDATCTDTVGAK